MATVTLDLPEPHYTLVTCTRDGMPEVISINSALLSFRHPEIFPWQLRITMFAERMIENGMPAPEESKLLFKIADRIERDVLKVTTAHGAVNALFLARSTWNESRELYFRVHDPEPMDVALKKMVKRKTWHDRGWRYEMEHDPSWEKAGYVFQVLSPSAKS
jgi:hypothetical protein